MELLLVSHRGIASGMREAVQMVMGPVAEQITAMELTEDEGIEGFSTRLEEHIVSWLTEGKKGMILADLKGGTPYNRAEMILVQHGLKGRAKVISGMNLALIVELLFRDLDVCSLDELREVLNCGRDGISCLDTQVQAGDGEDE